MALALRPASLAAGFEGRRRPAARDTRRPYHGRPRGNTPERPELPGCRSRLRVRSRLRRRSGFHRHQRRDTRGGPRCHHDRPRARSQYRARSADRRLCLRQAADADGRSHRPSHRRRRLCVGRPAGGAERARLTGDVRHPATGRGADRRTAGLDGRCLQPRGCREWGTAHRRGRPCDSAGCERSRPRGLRRSSSRCSTWPTRWARGSHRCSRRWGASVFSPVCCCWSTCS